MYSEGCNPNSQALTQVAGCPRDPRDRQPQPASRDERRQSATAAHDRRQHHPRRRPRINTVNHPSRHRGHYRVHKKQPPSPEDHHRTLGIVPTVVSWPAHGGGRETGGIILRKHFTVIDMTTCVEASLITDDDTSPRCKP